MFNIFKRKETIQPSVEKFDLSVFNSETELVHDTEQLEHEKEEYPNTNPVVDCYVFAHYGRWDLAIQTIKHSIKEQDRPMYKEILNWLNNNPSLTTWNSSWLIADKKDPLVEADRLVQEKKYSDALDLLEQALFESRGDDRSIRIALTKISRAISDGTYRLFSLFD